MPSLVRCFFTATMELRALSLAALALLAPLVLSLTVSYDQAYDQPSNNLASVACSDGSHGLLAHGFETFGSLPHFPNIGGAAAVGGWNSAQCGTCWELSYEGRSINVLAVDQTDSGWNIALGAMNTLTGNQATSLGRVEATATQVDRSKCGM
ncbi:Cerato-platanin-domain-containing protein [Lenzites betulinus]|nr:Cerato-platanin-domain-containing protein [Lenzites betulinus]